MTERKSMESERAELMAAIEAPTSWRAANVLRFERIKEIDTELRSLAAQDQKPVALAHVRLGDDGLFADLEVLDGTNLQPSMSPVALYLSPPPAPGWDGEVVPRRLLNERDNFIVSKGLWSEFVDSLKATDEALRHNAPPDSGAGTAISELEPNETTIAALREADAEWRTVDDFRKHWGSFCDADPFDGADTFPDRMEAAGFIRLRKVTRRDLEEISFPEERGIELGGYLWGLTRRGRAALAQSVEKK